MTKVMKKCHFLFGKDHKFLKLVFTILASYLTFEEFYTFLVVKPTYTTATKRGLKPNDFPDMILCPEPAIDIEAATSRGYEGVDDYYLGFNLKHGLDQIGWKGNKSEKVLRVSEEISVLKSELDCPSGDKTFFNFASSNISEAIVFVDFNLSKALYPNHICCKVKPPEVSKSKPVFSIQIIFSPEGKTFNTLKVFLADQLTSSYFDLQKTNMLGDEIISAPNGVKNYKVKILEDLKLDDDPQYQCIDYEIKGEYQKCVEEEILKQNLNFMNCTPPWMTDNEDLWCKGGIKYESEASLLHYLGFLTEVTISEYHPGKCSVPCKTKRYQSKQIGLKQMKEKRGIIIWFEYNVEITQSKFKTDVKTLISKIGGFIGISKNFLWLIILFLSSISLLMSHFKVHEIK